MCESSCFFIFLPAFGSGAVFYFSHSDSCVFLSHGGLNLHFPNAASFHEVIAICMSSSVKCFTLSFAHFPNGLEGVAVSFVGYVIYSYFLHSVGCLSILLIGSFTERWNFDKIVFFIDWVFCIQAKISLPSPGSQRYFLWLFSKKLYHFALPLSPWSVGVYFYKKMWDLDWGEFLFCFVLLFVHLLFLPVDVQ